MSKYISPYVLNINWTKDEMPWNEICIKVIEVFGLPGVRYSWRPTVDIMSFNFQSEKDFVLCKILLSEYITK